MEPCLHKPKGNVPSLNMEQSGTNDDRGQQRNGVDYEIVPTAAEHRPIEVTQQPPPARPQDRIRPTQEQTQPQSKRDAPTPIKTNQGPATSQRFPQPTLPPRLTRGERRKVRRLHRSLARIEQKTAGLERKWIKGPITMIRLRLLDAKAVAHEDALDNVYSRLDVQTQRSAAKTMPPPKGQPATGRAPVGIENNVIPLNRSRSPLGR